MKKQIGVIGGGAAGMMAAITAAREGAKVTIYERNDRVGNPPLPIGLASRIHRLHLPHRFSTLPPHQLKAAKRRCGIVSQRRFWGSVSKPQSERYSTLLPVATSRDTCS